MKYEVLTVGKVNSTVTGRSSSNEEPICNFSELLNRFRRYDWLAMQSAVVDFYKDLELVDVEGSTIDGGETILIKRIRVRSGRSLYLE